MMVEAPSSVLIIRMSSGGDVINAQSLLRALRASFPSLRIGWVVDDRFKELVGSDPDINTVHVAPIRRWSKMARSPARWPALLRELREFSRSLRQQRYEVCLDAQGILKSAFVARLAGAQRVLQMADDHLARLQWLFPGQRVEPVGTNAVGRTVSLAGAIGADISNPRLSFYVPEEAKRFAEELLAGHDFGTDGPLIALNPGASSPIRMWPPDRFAATARRLRGEIGARVLVLGGPSEVDLAESIARGAGEGTLCTAGKTNWLQLAALLERCDVAVSGDTGPMHLAAAVGTPVVALFGPANPARTGPFGQGHIVIQKPFPCQPCYRKPTCTDFPCMKAITVDEVVGAVLAILERNGGS